MGCDNINMLQPQNKVFFGLIAKFIMVLLNLFQKSCHYRRLMQPYTEIQFYCEGTELFMLTGDSELFNI